MPAFWPSCKVGSSEGTAYTSGPLSSREAGVAQLVEQLIRNQ